jgi:hypothetical protein
MGKTFGAFFIRAFEMKGVKLKFNLNKCEFAKTSIGLLGHVVTREGGNPTKFLK